MKRLLAVAVAFAAVTMFTQSEANAQHIQNNLRSGYGFGVGINSNFINPGFNSFGIQRGCCNSGFNEDLPYFAKFPPVYYSNIVARPVGISPFAAPAGIRPVELDFAPAKHVTKKNPFYDGKAQPVKSVPGTLKTLKQKTTWVPNPYGGTFASN